MTEEYLDVLDENGNFTGTKKSKAEIHRDGNWHACVQIVGINPNHEILLQKRSPNKISEPNRWDQAVAGHILAGEEPIDAAIREIDEELGLKFEKSNLEFMYMLQYQQVEHDGKFINNQHNHYYLFVTAEKTKVIKFDKNEISELKFYKPDDLLNHFKNKTLDTLFYEDHLNKFVNYVKNRAKNKPRFKK